jgi:hypothetical protein
MSFGAGVAIKKAQWAHGRIWGKFLSAAALGILLGIFVTLIEIQRGNGFAAIEAGPWTGWPRTEASEIDPYTRAILAYSGEIALSESEAISFVAYGDSDGAQFDSACDYIVRGDIPPARFWTLTLLSPEGDLIANKAERQGFTSSELLRSNNGQFAVALSRNARPGNWLPLPLTSKFILVLRFYDSELSAPAAALDAAHMPAIIKGRCG